MANLPTRQAIYYQLMEKQLNTALALPNSASHTLLASLAHTTMHQPFLDTFLVSDYIAVRHAVHFHFTVLPLVSGRV